MGRARVAQLGANGKRSCHGGCVIPLACRFDQRRIRTAAAPIREKHGKTGARLIITVDKPLTILLLRIDDLPRAPVLEVHPRPLPVRRLLAVALRVVIDLAPKVIGQLREVRTRLMKLEMSSGQGES